MHWFFGGRCDPFILPRLGRLAPQVMLLCQNSITLQPPRTTTLCLSLNTLMRPRRQHTQPLLELGR